MAPMNLRRYLDEPFGRVVDALTAGIGDEAEREHAREALTEAYIELIGMLREILGPADYEALDMAARLVLLRWLRRIGAARVSPPGPLRPETRIGDP